MWKTKDVKHLNELAESFRATVKRKDEVPSEHIMYSYENKAITDHEIYMGISKIINDLKEEITSLREEVKTLQESLDKGWDVYSERLADIEKFFQNIEFPKNISAWDLTKARRLYMDAVDKSGKGNFDNIPAWEELDIDTQIAYIKKAVEND